VFDVGAIFHQVSYCTDPKCTYNKGIVVETPLVVDDVKEQSKIKKTKHIDMSGIISKLNEVHEKQTGHKTGIRTMDGKKGEYGSYKSTDMIREVAKTLPITKLNLKRELNKLAKEIDENYYWKDVKEHYEKLEAK
jgi:hypothetical protein